MSGAEGLLPAALDAHRRGSELVGRAAERALLRADWLDVASGGWRVAVLSGEAGIGKTRLAAQVAEEARLEGAMVLFGGCAAEAIIPYQPMIEALRPSIVADPTLAPPALAPLLPGVLDPPMLDPGAAHAADRFPLFHAIGATLRAIARERSTVLVLDDLHWADADTVALLQHVLRTTVDLPLFIIGTVRDTDVDPRDPLSELLTDLRADERVRRVHVDGLRVDEIAQLGATLSGRPIAHDDPSAKAIHDRSHGNAFFVRELWAHVLEGRTELPTGVQATVLDRLNRLDDAEIDTLTMAATIGTRFPFDVLVEATGHLEAEVEAALDRATAIGLVAEQDGREIAYRFQHDLVRETLEATGLDARRQRRHLRVAAALVAVRGDRNPADVVRHLGLAGQLADSEEMLRQSRVAAARAEAVLAWADAAFLWRSAAEAAERLHRPAAERAELRLREGMSWGRANRLDAAVASYTEAEALAHEAGDAAIDARVVMWRATHTLYQSAADAPAALAMLDAARARAPFLDDATAAQLLSHLAVASWSSGHLDAGAEFAKQSITLGRDVGDLAASSRGEFALGVIAWLGLDLDDAAAHLEAAFSDGQRSGDPWLASGSEARLALNKLWRGQVAEAEDSAQSARARAVQDGNVSAQAMALGALAGVALIQGRFADVESLAVAADEALAAAGYQWFGPLLASTALAAKLAIGDWAGADRWLERTKAEGLDAFGSTDLSRWLLWLRVCALRRDHEVVRIEVERHPARIDGRIVPMLGTTQLLSVLVDLGDLVGVPLPSARLERRLGRASSGGLVIIEGNGVLLDRARAQAARLAGDLDHARELLAKALVTAKRIGAAPELAYCTLEEGRLELDLDRTRAASVLADARERFSALGMAPWQDRADALARWAGA